MAQESGQPGKMVPENEQWHLIRLNAAGVELLPNALILNWKKIGGWHGRQGRVCGQGETRQKPLIR